MFTPRPMRVSMEEKIHTVSRFLITTLHLFGFFPLDFEKGHSISTHRLSKWAVWNYIVLFLLILKFVDYGIHLRDHTQDMGFIETIAYVVMSTILWTTCLSFRLNAVIRLKGLGKFWQLNCQRLDAFARLNHNFDFCSSTCENLEHIHRIRTSTNRFLYLGIGCSSLGVAVSVWNFFHALVTDGGEGFGFELLQLLGQMLYFLGDSSRFLLVLYRTFFLKLYTSCFKMIGNELQAIIDLEKPQETGSNLFSVKTPDSSQVVGKVKMLALKLSTNPPHICPGHYFILNKMSLTQ
ncbi:unnamed protein product, partial [Allacma fusca]